MQTSRLEIRARHQAAGRSPRRRAGFTLLELLIVITVMTILAAIVIPRFEPSIHDQLTSTAQIVAADAAYARSLAVSNNTTYRLTFDVAQNRYVLRHSGGNSVLDVLPASPFRHGGDSADRQTTDLDDLPHIGPTVEIVAIQKASASPTNVSDVEFGPLGETTRGEQTVIWLGCGDSAGRRYVCVCIDPVSGLASIGEFQAAPPPSGS